MAVTTVRATARYIPEGVRETYWAPGTGAFANYNSPGTAELRGTATLRITKEIADMGDWTVTADSVDAPDMGTKFTAQVTGKIHADNTTITMYADLQSNDIRKQIIRGQAGYIVMLDEGDVTGQTMDIFPVTVSSVSKPTTMGSPSTLIITFTPTAIPAENVAIP
jgi:hypothetical protein